MIYLKMAKIVMDSMTKSNEKITYLDIRSTQFFKNDEMSDPSSHKPKV